MNRNREAVKIVDHLTKVLEEERKKYEISNNIPDKADDSIIIRNLLKAWDISQRQFSDMTDIDMTTLSLIVSGKRNLTRKHIGKICKVFDIEPTVFRFEDY